MLCPELSVCLSGWLAACLIGLTELFRESKSRNKASVGEPAEGSFLAYRLSLSNIIVSDSVGESPPIGEI